MALKTLREHFEEYVPEGLRGHLEPVELAPGGVIVKLKGTGHTAFVGNLDTFAKSIVMGEEGKPPLE